MTNRPAGMLIIVIIMTGSIVFTGCASVPKDAGFSDVQNIARQRTGHQVEWNRSTPEDGEVTESIHSMLQQELALDEAVQISLLNNRSLQAMYEELGIAQADVVQAGLLRNPIFGASFRFPDRPADGHRGANTEFSVVQDFLDLLVIPLRKKIAATQFEQTKLHVGNAILNLASEVQSAYYTLQADKQILEMRLTVAWATEAAAELASRQHEAGTLSMLDLMNQQGFHAQAKLDVAQTDIQIIAGREHLNRLMGLWGMDTTWNIPHRLPELPENEIMLDQFESKAISQRLDLAALRKEVETIAYALSLTRRYRYFYVFEVGVDTEHDVADDVNFTGPNVTIELPIFNQRQAEIARLEAHLRQRRQQLSSLAIDIRSEVRALRDQLLIARNRVKYYHDSVLPLRQRIVEESQLYYNGMLIGVYELLLAKQNQINAGREYIEALRDYWIIRSELERAVGENLTGISKTAQTSSQSTEQITTQASESFKYDYLNEVDNSGFSHIIQIETLKQTAGAGFKPAPTHKK
ncbi:MAG: TolC family protein [Candidatus Jettenia caeni]|nr:MAG: TolC family protein [Candidatus Jettenia caeni]